MGYDGGVPLLRIDLLPSEPGSALKWSRKHWMQMEQTRKELTNSTIDRSLVRIQLQFNTADILRVQYFVYLLLPS